MLNARLAHHINSAVIRKALALDLQYFEDASFYDKLQNARREADFRALGIINGSFTVVQNIITLLSFAVILLAFNPLIALILFGGQYYSYGYLSVPVSILGTQLALNRILALAFAVLMAVGLYFGLTRTRTGTAIRAIAVDPNDGHRPVISYKRLGAIDHERYCHSVAGSRPSAITW